MQRTAKGGFHFPKDCVGLTYSAGERVGDGIKITVVYIAPTGRMLTLNGIPLPESDHCTYKLDYVINNQNNRNQQNNRNDLDR